MEEKFKSEVILKVNDKDRRFIFSAEYAYGDILIDLVDTINKSCYFVKKSAKEITELTKNTLYIDSLSLFKIIESALVANNKHYGIEFKFSEKNTQISVDIIWHIEICPGHQVSKTFSLELEEKNQTDLEKISIILEDILEIKENLSDNSSGEKLNNIKKRVIECENSIDYICNEIEKIKNENKNIIESINGIKKYVVENNFTKFKK